MKKKLKSMSPGRIIALGFAGVILLGSLLLIMPFSVREGVQVRYIDVLYTSASAVCVTGLIAIDVGTAFTPVGQTILAILIQVGGLGVTSIGAGIILLMGRKINIKGRNVIREASNLDSGKGIVRFVQSVFITTVVFEIIGAILSFVAFVLEGIPARSAIGYSIFHSIAAFNNAGFDNLGLSGELYSNVSIIPYQDNILLNIVTCGLIFFGGIGFLVIREVIQNRFNWKKFSMHTKVVLSVTAVLLVSGTLLLKLTEDIPWLGAFFFSVSTRTAGFSTYDLSAFSNAGLVIVMLLMFIGASPGSTGGGIKTSTIFVLFQGIKSAATNKSEKAFKYSVPSDAFRKAAVITLLGVSIIATGTYIISALEPDLALKDILFEVISAFGTVGLSMGITSQLGVASKLLSILIMYIGRLGPLTIVSLWYFNKGERVRYPEGNIAIG